MINIIISAIIISLCFIIPIILIATEKANRAIAILTGAVICQLTLTFAMGQDITLFIQFLFGTAADGFVNLKAIVLIIAMLFIVNIAHTAGVFQFLAFKIIQLTKGRAEYLLISFCLLTSNSNTFCLSIPANRVLVKSILVNSLYALFIFSI